MQLTTRFLARILSTFFYVGYFPVCPGTFASFVAALLFFVIPEIPWYIMLVALFFLFLLGVWSSNLFAADIEKNDPSEAVIDEVVGMGLSLLLVPKTLFMYFMAFLFFRFFDIVKVFPISRSEKLPGGWGIMMDDVIAGFFSLVCLKAISMFFNGSFCFT